MKVEESNSESKNVEKSFLKKFDGFYAIGILTFFLILILLRVIVDNLEFVQALDKVLRNTFSVIWEFVSAPTIFITLIVVIVFFRYEEIIVDGVIKKLINLLIEKIPGLESMIFPGGTELKFIADNKRRINQAIESGKNDFISAYNKIDVFTRIIENLNPDWYYLIIDLHKRDVKTNELNSLLQKHLYHKVVRFNKNSESDDEYNRIRSYGFASAAYNQLLSYMGILYTIEDCHNYDNCWHFNFDENLIRIIEEKIVELKSFDPEDYSDILDAYDF